MLGNDKLPGLAWRTKDKGLSIFRIEYTSNRLEVRVFCIHSDIHKLETMVHKMVAQCLN